MIAGENSFGFGYCLIHEREFPLVDLNNWNYPPKKNRVADYVHPDPNDNSKFCRGPIVFCPPPPLLTKEQWETILDKEYERYANEIK